MTARFAANGNSATRMLPHVVGMRRRPQRATTVATSDMEKHLVLTAIQVTLEPLHLIIAGLLFFNLAWLATRRWLVLGVIGLSAMEMAPMLPWAGLARTSVTQTQLHLFETFISFAAGDAAPAAITLINASLALLIWGAIRRLQRWARTTVARNEAAFLARIDRDTRTWNTAPNDL